MRVSDVAKRAGTTVAMIYRRFVDRDGLLARTLADYYRSRIRGVLEIINGLIEQPGPVAIDDVVAATPPPHHPGSEEIHRNLPRIVVAASENLALRLVVQEVIREGMRQFDEAIERLLDRMPADQQFDPRIYTYFVLNLTWIYNDLRGDEAITNEQYGQFLRKLLSDSTRAS